MKRLHIILPIILVISCSKSNVYFSGSVGIYPEDRIFWVRLLYPDYRYVEDARVVLDSTSTIPYYETKGGYYKEDVSEFTYNSQHTVEVEMTDKDNIYGVTKIPSHYTISIDTLGDSIFVEWTHAESLLTSPDSWRVMITQEGDTIRDRSFSNEVNLWKTYPLSSFNDIVVYIDAIRYGDLEGARGNSVFAGIVKRKKVL